MPISLLFQIILIRVCSCLISWLTVFLMKVSTSARSPHWLILKHRKETTVGLANHDLSRWSRPITWQLPGGGPGAEMKWVSLRGARATGRGGCPACGQRRGSLMSRAGGKRLSLWVEWNFISTSPPMQIMNSKWIGFLTAESKTLKRVVKKDSK